MHPSLSKGDLVQLEQSGIELREAGRQLKILSERPSQIRLDRPCRIGDGIRALSAEAQQTAIDHYDRATQAGRFSKFIPATDPARHMLKDLLSYLESSETWAQDDTLEGKIRVSVPESVREFLQHIPQFPFAGELFRVLSEHQISIEDPARPAPARTVIEELLKPHGLGLATQAKALIAFHHYPGGSRTALEEHLVESAVLVRDGGGTSRLHLAVAKAHRSTFEAFLRKVRGGLEASLETSFDITLSEQVPSTATLALDESGRPFRTRDGRLFLSPGGHGALLSNLEATEGDFVLIKNIDNILYQPAPEVVHWMKVLGGELARIEKRVSRLLKQLGETLPPPFRRSEAITLLKDTFGVEVPVLRNDDTELAFLRERLRRPIRVCGVVPNRRQGGGGPFWVRHDETTVTRQIVEASRISKDQEHLMAEATHWNPVALACSLRDDRGHAFRLHDFVDPKTVRLLERNHSGHRIRTLEHPGLWNGSMAGWNTVFIETPTSIFTTARTMMDLLEPAHQGPQPLLAASGGSAW